MLLISPVSYHSLILFFFFPFYHRSFLHNPFYFLLNFFLFGIKLSTGSFAPHGRQWFLHQQGRSAISFYFFLFFRRKLWLHCLFQANVHSQFSCTDAYAITWCKVSVKVTHRLSLDSLSTTVIWLWVDSECTRSEAGDLPARFCKCTQRKQDLPLPSSPRTSAIRFKYLFGLLWKILSLY